MLLFDNRIYGLTKGQYSPTSERGKKTKSTPYGSIDRPFNPITLAVGAGATFVARSVDVFTPHLKQTLTEAEAHRGTSFVQIYQNCNIFNDGAFNSFREKAQRPDNTLLLEHGKPLIFGKDSDRGIRIGKGYRPEVVRLGNGIEEDDLLVHDEQGSLGYLAMLSELESLPDFPVPIGVFCRTEAPTFDAEMRAQIEEITERKGKGDLAQVLASGNTWVIE
jgi:2-oxoglutarate ferredoxin oxidoreductase subunit beta